MPWENQQEFERIYREEGPRAATDWLYHASADGGFLSEAAHARNLQWCYKSAWGPILISVNRTKPEKDPRDIAAALAAEQADGKLETSCAADEQAEGSCAHPDCVFCWDSPRESRHLRVHLSLNDQPLSLHFSPYAYFDEHCIVATFEHRPMQINRRTLSDLVELCELFPDYFFGSNADLPIVGGSILNHHHYQGGRFAFPLDHARSARNLGAPFPGQPEVQVDIMKWPLSTVRLASANREQLIDAAAAILRWWQCYSNEALGIVARDEAGTLHNTITPIARKSAGTYVLYLVLRCNITSPEHPLGVFHPHSEVHRVKKENIGLIEAMGLAILPPRVEDEFDLGDGSMGDDYGDRLEVGALFTLGLEQCRVLDTDQLASELVSLARKEGSMS